jgi:hypothetical protein
MATVLTPRDATRGGAMTEPVTMRIFSDYV